MAHYIKQEMFFIVCNLCLHLNLECTLKLGVEYTIQQSMYSS